MALYDDALDDGLSVILTGVGFGHGVASSDTVNLYSTSLNYAYFAGAVLSEIIALQDVQAPAMVMGLTIAEVVELLDTFAHAYPVALTDGFEVGDVQAIVWALTVLDRLAFPQTLKLSSVFGLALLEAIATSDAALAFFGRSDADSLGFGDMLAPSWTFLRQADDDITLGDNPLANTLFMRVVTESLEWDDTSIVQAIFNSAILEEDLCIHGGWVDPGTGEFTTWAINTRTGAVTEYSNYVFNSFAKIGNNYYGANDDGLWLLNNETDAGANIVADIKGGFLQFGDTRYTQLDGVYLGMRTDDNASDFILKIVTPGTQALPQGATYVYQFNPKNMRTTKINIGKGLRTRYFSWELITPGPSFDLDSIEFVPLISKRRV